MGNHCSTFTLKADFLLSTKSIKGVHCVPNLLPQASIFFSGLSQMFIGLHYELDFFFFFNNTQLCNALAQLRRLAVGQRGHKEAGNVKKAFKLALIAEIFDMKPYFEKTACPFSHEQTHQNSRDYFCE